MTKIEILSIIQTILGTYRQTGKENYAFFCPVCKHYKRKLELNLETYNYHCWTCVPKLGGRNFYYLFRDFPNVADTQLEKIKEYTNTKRYVKRVVSNEKVFLPNEFKSLQENHGTLEYRHAIAYLKRRGITNDDIEKYNLGYCESGEYENRIIIPSYSEDGELNYFVGRDFFESYLSYKNPNVSKNIIFFESLISWDNPLILCEGVFDAMAIKRNVVPLLGKNISEKLEQKINLANTQDIYICLDNDAKKDAINIAQKFISAERNIYLVILDKKDPSEIGFKEIHRIIKRTNKFDFKELVRTRLFE